MWNVLGKYHCCFSSKEKAENRVEKESETSKLCTISLLKGDSTTRVYIPPRPQNSFILAQIWLESTLDGLVLLFHATNRGKNAPETTEIDLNRRLKQSLRRINSDTMVLADRFPTLF